jgi:hypothetical protein
MTGLAEKIIAVDAALDAASLPHAFGGALALAWCTGRARGTIDIDVNVFVPGERAAEVLSALPTGVAREASLEAELAREGQIRLWWAQTPVDVFLDVTPFHQEAARRVRHETFLERSVPFLACDDLAVFKAFFDRTKDWADLEEMQSAGTLDIDRVIAVIVHYLGADDPRIAKLEALRSFG